MAEGRDLLILNDPLVTSLYALLTEWSFEYIFRKLFVQKNLRIIWVLLVNRDDLPLSRHDLVSDQVVTLET